MPHVKKTKTSSQSPLSQDAFIDLWLDRIACFDPMNFLSPPRTAKKKETSSSVQSEKKRGSSSDKRKDRTSRQERGKRIRKPRSSSVKRIGKYRGSAAAVRTDLVNPVPTATMSDVSPGSDHGGRHSPNKNMIDSIIDKGTVARYHQQKKKLGRGQGIQGVKIAPLVVERPPSPPGSGGSVKSSLFVVGGPTNKSRPSLTPRSRKSMAMLPPAVWQRKTVSACRRVGPF